MYKLSVDLLYVHTVSLSFDYTTAKHSLYMLHRYTQHIYCTQCPHTFYQAAVCRPSDSITGHQTRTGLVTCQIKRHQQRLSFVT